MAPLDRLPTDQAPHVSTAAKPDSWTLQTLGEVTLHSPIVRLRDIVLPVGIPDAVWEKIGPAAVTLVPTDGRRLTIERQRLLEYVQRHLTPEQRIRWTGPESIYVQYEGQVREVAFPTGPQTAPSITPPKTVHKIATENPARQAVPGLMKTEPTALAAGLDAGLNTHSRPEASAYGSHQSQFSSAQAFPSPPTRASAVAQEPVRQAAYAKAAEGPGPQPFAKRSAGETDHADSAAVPGREVDRLKRLIESAITGQWPEMAETFDFEIDPQHGGLRDLRNIRRVDALRLNEPIRSGSQLIQIDGTTIENSVTAEIQVHVHPRPEAVFVRNNIRRGQRVQRNDLELRRLVGSQAVDGLVKEIDQIVGMEARTSLGPTRPLRRDDVKPPTVIHRGDLIEIRVAGGGIVVRSNAKALDDGAVGELIEVETQQPRKRLMASVVQSGQVEILTRAPNLKR